MAVQPFPLKHVAIIMDGNGRWAQERLHKRVWGHVRGARNVSAIVEEAVRLKIGALTLYTFSTENWSRPVDEISTLFKIFKKFVQNERKRIIEQNISFRVMGSLEGVPEETRLLAESLQEETAQNLGMKLNLAFGYGGRQELVDAINRFIEKNPGKKISFDEIEEGLLTQDIGDVDLMIRTGGDQRISNFLLWQVAYAELFFTNTKWPDFTLKEFREILDDVVKRERRYGAVCAAEGMHQTLKIADANKKVVVKCV